MPSKVAGRAPWRSTSMPSISSAPATIPAISDATLAPALAPTCADSRTCWAASRSNPTNSASRIAGTKPARDTRLGSSNLTCVLAAA